MLPHHEERRSASGLTLMAAGFVMAFASAPGQTIFIAQFIAAFSTEFGLSAAELGTAFGAATLISAIVLVLVGGMVDRYPLRALAVGSLLLLAAATALMGLHHGWLAFMACLTGVRFFGQGMMIHLATTAMARWFSHNRGRALAAVGLGVPVTEASLPLLITLSIQSWGWRSVWLATAAVIVAVFVPVLIALLRDRRANISVPIVSHETASPATIWRRRDVLSDRLFLYALPVIIGPAILGGLFIFHQASLVQAKGWDLRLFIAMFALLPATTITATLLAGPVIDRLGAWRLLPAVMLPAALGCLLLGTIDALWTMPIVFVLLGVTNGFAITAASALWAELYGTRSLGRIRSLAAFAIVVTTALSPAIGGVLIDRGVPLTTQALVLALVLPVTSALLWITRRHFADRVRLARGGEP